MHGPMHGQAMTWIKYPRGGFGIGQRRHVRVCRLQLIEREREREQTKMIDDGNDISCMCACVCLCVSDSVTVVALDTHHHHHGHHHHLFSRRLSHSFNVIHSFIQRDVGITQHSMIHDP